jgi:hypothetical protein
MNNNNNENIYHLKFQRKLINTVLNCEFKTINDLTYFINFQESFKMLEKGKTYTVYKAKIIDEVFDNLLKHLKSIDINFPFVSANELCLFFINEFKQCLKDFQTFTNNNSFLITDNEIKFKLIKTNTSCSISLTRYEILCIHAFSFFHIEWNEYNNEQFCDISFMQLYDNDNFPLGLQKLLCYFNYYYFIFTHKELYNEIVTIEQKHFEEKANFKKSTCLLNNYNFVENGIETCLGENHVDFANARLIYCIWPSVTQEELLLCVRPELVVCCIFIEKMSDDNVILMKNSLHINKSTGYGETFKFNGEYDDINYIKRKNTIIAMDSLDRNSYDENDILRDLHKCYLGFKFSTNEVNDIICIGKWGCGAFGNDPYLKLLEMIIVASILGKKNIHFHWMDKLNYIETYKLIEKCISKNLSIDKILNIVFSYKYIYGKFENYMFKEIDKM